VNSIRLLPLVIFAAAALLVLKGIDLFAGDHGMAVSGAGVAEAQEFSELTNQDIAAADRASDSLFERAEPAPVSSGQLDAVPLEEDKQGDKAPIGSTTGNTQTEQAILDRLSERRAELDLYAEELGMRAALVEAAETRLEERVAALEALEGRINTLVEERKAIDDAQLADLVSMYETMRARDAAGIFDQLDLEVLLRVTRQMNPRKLAPVLAAMSASRAQELTAQLASFEEEPQLDEPIDDFSSLPQILGE
jgi:flagellar motility protein MotE (MotC chaperone)